MSAMKRGGLAMQSSVRIGILATLPVEDRRPLMLANIKEFREVSDCGKNVWDGIGRGWEGFSEELLGCGRGVRSMSGAGSEVGEREADLGWTLIEGLVLKGGGCDDQGGEFELTSAEGLVLRSSGEGGGF